MRRNEFHAPRNASTAKSNAEFPELTIGLIPYTPAPKRRPLIGDLTRTALSFANTPKVTPRRRRKIVPKTQVPVKRRFRAASDDNGVALLYQREKLRGFIIKWRKRLAKELLQYRFLYSSDETGSWTPPSPVEPLDFKLPQVPHYQSASNIITSHSSERFKGSSHSHPVEASEEGRNEMKLPTQDESDEMSLFVQSFKRKEKEFFENRLCSNNFVLPSVESPEVSEEATTKSLREAYTSLRKSLYFTDSEENAVDTMAKKTIHEILASNGKILADISSERLHFSEAAENCEEELGCNSDKSKGNSDDDSGAQSNELEFNFDESEDAANETTPNREEEEPDKSEEESKEEETESSLKDATESSFSKDTIEKVHPHSLLSEYSSNAAEFSEAAGESDSDFIQSVIKSASKRASRPDDIDSKRTSNNGLSDNESYFKADEYFIESAIRSASKSHQMEFSRTHSEDLLQSQQISAGSSNQSETLSDAAAAKSDSDVL